MFFVSWWFLFGTLRLGVSLCLIASQSEVGHHSGMSDDVTTTIFYVAGAALILLVSIWGILACAKTLISTFRSDQTFDRNLSPVYKSENPKLFYLHVLELLLLTVFCVLMLLSLIIAAGNYFLSE